MSRLLLVYKMLGQVLDNPQSYGLGERAPKPLAEALSTMRRSLREEIAEEKHILPEDWLSDELSQDADRARPAAAKRSGRSRRSRTGT